MAQRFISLWFRHLVTDWLTRQQPDLKQTPFALCQKQHGRVIITAVNTVAEQAYVKSGMALADARALLPELEHFDEKPDLPSKLLNALGDWCIRYTPSVSINLPDGLMLDVTGCAHLMGGETPLLKDIIIKLRAMDYDVRGAMADTPGAAWAMARYGLKKPIVPSDGQKQALESLPPAALRLDQKSVERLTKLGITKISDLMALPRPTLSRRFGQEILLKLDQALGGTREMIKSKPHIEPFIEQLNSSEGISTAEGIALALKMLLERICTRLQKEHKGLRTAVLECFRLDGIRQNIEIRTSRPTNNPKHLFKLFENKLQTIEPALGIELFILKAGHIEIIMALQTEITNGAGCDDAAIGELVDKIANHLQRKSIYKFVPQEHHWPERSIKCTPFVMDKAAVDWHRDKLRPIRLLARPEPIEVTAPVPDYPPMMFRYKGALHRIRKADGPERIEREWWMDKGDLRDYYRLEDEQGQRYWVFRSGHFMPDKRVDWFLHGFFA